MYAGRNKKVLNFVRRGRGKNEERLRAQWDAIRARSGHKTISAISINTEIASLFSVGLGSINETPPLALSSNG